MPGSAWSWLLLFWALMSAVLWAGHYAGDGKPLSDAGLLQWDLQPGLWPLQPWRLWTAALVHWSGAHLLLNLLACVALGAWGTAAGLGRPSAIAWLAAWPITHILLAFTSQLQHYGGLSGVLHAGVAIGVWSLLVQGPGPRRWIGAAVGMGLVVKLVLEVPMISPWTGVEASLAALPGAPDIQVAGEAHLAGAVAGLGCAAFAQPALRVFGR